MLKHLGGWAMLSSPPMLPFSLLGNTHSCKDSVWFSIKAVKLSNKRVLGSWVSCAVRRRVRYDEEEDGDEDEGDEEYGYNEEIAMLELYSQSAKGEALIVHAMVDEEEVEVLIFKGFSSSLSYRTSPDPSRSILPARAVIKFIDRIKGPFNPSNIEYLQKGLTWEAFKEFLST
ncbi:hypothetical protein CMV_028918 [Castanea mollissima]|uniref:DUF7734 domain-containing protein n=1 Tax=Castanea mollissima TaxID=60419 RepID=A0A8J4QGE1_9ROSI|nr:hypothetical protein CMV_028918 [Castanea mollissima]